MTKVEITEWGELNIIEKLLSDYTLHTSEWKVRRMIHARTLFDRGRPAIVEATTKL